MSPRVRKALWVVVGGVVLFVAVVGVAHTPWGRPLLGLLRSVPGCPLGFDAPVDPVRAEAFRQETFRKSAGVTAAPALPALGFVLGQTRRADVEAWLRTLGAPCDEKRSGLVLACAGLPEAADAGPRIDDAHLQFDPAGVLVAVDVFRTTPVAPGLAHVQATQQRLTASLQAAPKVTGTADAAWIAAGALRSVAAEWRFAQYEARVSLMNFGSGRFRVREQYEWAPPPVVAQQP